MHFALENFSQPAVANIFCSGGETPCITAVHFPLGVCERVYDNPRSLAGTSGKKSYMIDCRPYGAPFRWPLHGPRHGSLANLRPAHGLNQEIRVGQTPFQGAVREGSDNGSN